MRLAVFGEANRTRHCLVKRALDAGYNVTVLEDVATTVKKRSGLTVVRGDINDVVSVRRAMSRVDAVLCLLHNRGHVFDDAARQWMENILTSMEENAVRRLVVFSSLHHEGETRGPTPNSDVWGKFIRFFRKLHDEQSGVEGMLKRTNIDWTIVSHPPTSDSLSDDIADSKKDPEQFRLDLAKHMVSQITDVSYLHDVVSSPA